MGTATALVLVVVVVLGFGHSTVSSSSVSSPSMAFTPGFLAPTIQRRPLSTHRQQLVTQSSSNAVHGFNAVQGRARSPLQMQSIHEENEDIAAVEAAAFFTIIDLDGDGIVTMEEFQKYLAAFGYARSASTGIFLTLDTDLDAKISIDEIRELVGSGDGRLATTLLRRIETTQMFRIIDENSDGEISAAELRSYLIGIGYTEARAEAVLRSIDSNSDGKISEEELFDGFEKFSALRADCLSASWAQRLPQESFGFE